MNNACFDASHTKPSLVRRWLFATTNVVRGVTRSNERPFNYWCDSRHIVQHVPKPEITAANALMALTLICENRCKCKRKDLRLFEVPCALLTHSLALASFYLPCQFQIHLGLSCWFQSFCLTSNPVYSSLIFFSVLRQIIKTQVIENLKRHHTTF